MKKLVKRVGSSSHAQFVIFGITLLLAVVGVVAVSATPKAFASRASEQNAGSPGDNPVVQQEKSKLYAQPVRMVGERILGPVGLGGIDRPARIPKSLNPTANALINNNNGSTGTAYFTQSETTLVAFGSTIVVGFNDSGSFNGGDHFTGWSRSTDGGATWTDGGTLPFSQIGDAGDPVMARDNTTGRIYFATLGLNGIATIQVFLSDDGGATFQAPINGTPGGSAEDKDWITVDNFGGAGNGNVYLVSRRFGSPQRGINFYRSTDGGATFGPSGGTNITIDSLSQGAFVTVTPDHSVHAYWYDGPTIQVRKSTDQGLTFDAPVTVAFGLIGGANGDLGLTGMRQGTGTFDYFRSNEFPHAAVNPVSGSIYVTYDNQGAGSDKADVFLTQSTDGGATWTAPVKVNDDSTTTDQWMPTVAVSTAGDRLGIFYYSRQEDPASNNLFKRYGRIATISGGTVTFTPSVAVSDTASLPEFGRDSVISGVYMGDYDQVYATPGAFNIVWSDNRSDLPGGAPRKDPNVYYDKISLAPVPQSAFSRKVQGGAFDVALPLTGNVGIECRSGGATNDYQMIVNFASAVTVESVAVTSGTGSVSSFSVSGSQVTVNLTGVTNVQRITVTLFNVNDGTHMGDVPVSMGVLVGDVNGNGLVNASDVSLTKSQVGQPVSGSNFREDVNANGLINSVDVAQVKANVGTALPP